MGVSTDPAAKWSVLSDGLAGAATTYTEGSYYRGDLIQYGGNIYRHKIGVTTNVSPLQVGVGSIGNEQYNGQAIWDILVKGFNFVGNFNLYMGIDNLSDLFSEKSFLIMFWIHFVSINLFTGGWIVKDSEKFMINKFLIFIPLIITYLIGPLGLFVYWLIRIFYAKNISLYD